MENNNLVVRRFHCEVERERERHKEMEMEGEVGKGTENGDSDVWEEEERENATGDAAAGRIGEINKDLPSVDDVCPICFDGFSIPCRSNCGHWFCATCILQFWMFRSSIQPCKCPLCCCQIVNLEPRVSRIISGADDSVEVLKKVHQYNGLYVTGVFGAFHKIQAFPLFMGRMFRVLIDPDCLRCIHYITRIFGLSLALLYEQGEFEFMPTGGMGIQRMFNLGGSVLIVVLFTIGVVYRWVLRRRARRLAALQVWDS
ncbi:hypothetical protein ACS0TY_011571 [Phlomoides rotata]